MLGPMRPATLVVLVGLVLTATGCGGETTVTVTSPPETVTVTSTGPGETVTTPAETVTVTAPPATASPSVDLAAGRTMGRILAMKRTNGVWKVDIDVGEFLVGEDANQWCLAAHVPGCPPVANDYLIRDVEDLRGVPIAPDATLLIITSSGPAGEGDIAKLARVVTTKKDEPPYGWGWPAWFTITDGVVTKIEQQYVP